MLRHAIVATFLLLPAAVHGQFLKTTISTPNIGPSSVAVNPVTNKTYVIGFDADVLTIIDGATDSASTLTGLGLNPVAIAVNPATNKIYIANEGSTVMGVAPQSSIQVIDGATNAITTLASGVNPFTIAVNPVTNKIYVGDVGDTNLTVIDGATNAITTIPLAVVGGTSAIAVDQVTNRIYLASGAAGGSTFTVLDGATNNTVTQLTLGAITTAISVNEVTNKIYVASGFASNVAVIDGATETLSATLPTVTGYPIAIAINPVTNMIYVANNHPAPGGSPQWFMTVIDGASNATASVQVGNTPYFVAVDPGTNQVYEANGSGASVSIFNGATAGAPASTSLSATLTVGQGPETIGINPLTHKAYVGNYLGASVSVIEEATTQVATVPAGVYPIAVALNPVTNMLYVVNEGAQPPDYTGTLTVINAVTLAVQATVQLTVEPAYVAVNPVTNQIYVACYGSNQACVQQIDGASNTVVGTTSVENNPTAIVVNPVSNKVYVASYNGSMAVIDGATLDTSYLPFNPIFLALNPATNTLYLSTPSKVVAIDGTTNATLGTITVTAGGAIAVNPVTNRVYAINSTGLAATLDVINGATNTLLTTVSTYLDSDQIAINTLTNRIYVVSQGGGGTGYVSVINGATNAASVVYTPQFPEKIAVNEAANLIYVADTGPGQGNNNSGNQVSVIDGFNNSLVNVTTGNAPAAMAVNPVTGMTYVVDGASNNVSVIGTQATVPLAAGITGIPGNVTSSATPTISFTAQSLFSPTAPAIQNVYYQVDGFLGAWTPTTGGPAFSATLAALAPGIHTLYAFADDGQDATSTQTGSPFDSGIAVYQFLVGQAATHFSVTAPSSTTVGNQVSVTVTALDASNNPALTYAGTVQLTSSDGAAVLPPNSTLTNGAGTFSATLNTPGSQTVTATDTVNASITGVSSTIAVADIPPLIGTQPVSQSVNAGSDVVLTVAATGNPPLGYQWYFNGSPIAGATSTILSMTDVLAASGGGYTVKVTDGYGGATTSNTAVLTIMPAIGTAIISGGPGSRTTFAGSTVVFTIVTGGLGGAVVRAGSAEHPLLTSGATYQWQFNGTNLTDGNGISGSTGPQLVITAAAAANEGDYSCLVTISGVSTQSNASSLIIATTGTPGFLVNISSRAFVGTGANILIGGFYIGGSTSRSVLIQALGPALANEGVPGTLQHPILTIYNSSGAVIYSNTGWGSSNVLLKAAAAVYASPALQPDSADSEALLTLAPGGYTAQVSGAGGATGVALCAIYQLP